MASSQGASAAGHEGEKQFRVNLPDGQVRLQLIKCLDGLDDLFPPFFTRQTATVHLKENMTVEEFLASACGKRGLNPAEHFVRVKKRRDMDNSNHFVPHRTDLIDSYVSVYR